MQACTIGLSINKNPKLKKGKEKKRWTALPKVLCNPLVRQVPLQLSTVFHLCCNSRAITIRQIKISIKRPLLKRTNKTVKKGKVLYTDLKSTCGENLQSTAATN